MSRQSLSTMLLLPVLSLIVAVPLATQTPSERQVRHAIGTFCEQPLDDKGRAAAKVLIEFAEASAAVSITVAQEYTPWLKADRVPKHSELLLRAYIAGNTLGQLDSGVKGNDPYSATIQVFRVYRHLKANDPTYSVPEIEDLLELHRKGALPAHFAKLAENRQK